MTATRPLRFGIQAGAPIGPVIDDLLLLIECRLEGEWEGRVVYIPIRDAP